MSYGSMFGARGGIVMTSDRRGCYRDKGTDKLLTMGNNIAISVGTYDRGTFVRGREICEILEEFCKNNTFNDPESAAYALFYHLSGLDQRAGVIVHIAGYGHIGTKFYPEMRLINIRQIRNECYGGYGFFWNTFHNELMRDVACGIERIPPNKITVRQAIELSQFAVDTQRERLKSIGENVISEAVDMLVISPGGIRWIKKGD